MTEGRKKKRLRELAPLALFLGCLGAILVFQQIWPLFVFLQPPVTLAGLVPLFAGIALVVSALRCLRRSHTTIVPFHEARRLVTDGIFRYSRNPVYLGEVLIFLGLWVLTGAFSALLVVVTHAIVADRWLIRAEEKMLLAKFGQEFEDYSRKVGRWIGRKDKA